MSWGHEDTTVFVWFCCQQTAKPGSKTAAPPCLDLNILLNYVNLIKCIWQCLDVTLRCMLYWCFHFVFSFTSCVCHFFPYWSFVTCNMAMDEWYECLYIYIYIYIYTFHAHASWKFSVGNTLSLYCLKRLHVTGIWISMATVLGLW